jgi:hypothetical protein
MPPNFSSSGQSKATPFANRSCLTLYLLTGLYEKSLDNLVTRRAEPVGGEFLVRAKIEFKINLANCHPMR